MRKFTLSFFKALFLLLISSQSIFAQEWLGEYRRETGNTSADINYYDVKSWADEHFKEIRQQLNEEKKYEYSFLGQEDGEVGTYIKYKRWEWYWSTRIKQDGSLGYLDGTQFREKEKTSHLRKAVGTPTWKSIGFTTNSGGYWGMGKADCIGLHPTNANIFYVGSDGGGLWKTTDGGLNYTAIGDFLPISQVARIIVDAVNPNTVYIALGPKGGERSMGVYKSLDAGVTFAPTALADDYSAGSTFHDMIASESNSSILLVAKSNGIFRTANGGTTWTKVANWSCRDLEWKPGSTTRVYAAREDYWGASEIYYSDNAGVDWFQLTNIGTQKVSLEIAVTPANPNIVAYSLMDHGITPKGKKLYVSKSNGSSGSFKFKSNLLEEEHIFISGLDEKIFYNGGVDVSKSIDSGKVWTRQTSWNGSNGLLVIHADVRNMYYGKTDRGFIYFCNDGGIVRYNERTNEWKELNNGLQLTQYYSIACAQTDSVIVTAGSQDNGGSRRNANKTWKNTNGGDAMVQAIDPTNANIMYTTYIQGNLYRSNDAWGSLNYTISDNIPGGKPNGDWVTPYVIDPKDPTVIVAGYDNVYRGTSRGDFWTKISNNLTNGEVLKAIAVAPTSSQIIYCAGDYKQPDGILINKIYKTEDMGTNWSAYTLPSKEKITEIAISSTDPNLVFVTVGGWTDGEKVYASIDGGQSWTNYSDGLPNVPTNTIIFHKGNANNALYVGNDIGIYYRDKNMARWETYSAGLPNTKVTDLDIQYSAKLLRASTYGRGAWEAPLIINTNQVEDCAGVAGGSAKTDNCGVCAGGTTGVVANTACCSPGATVAVERWTNVTGNNVSDIPVSTSPQQTIYIKDLDKNFYGEDDLGHRIKGLICPPETGSYTFWIASDDYSEFWLGTTEQPSSKTKRAFVNGAVGEKDYDATPSQKSLAVTLTKGSKYYFEVLHKEGGGDAHLTVAWAYGTQPRTVVKGVHIVQGGTVNTPPAVSISSPANNATYAAPANISIGATASDNQGAITKVEFYQGTTKISTDSTGPSFTFNWLNVAAGTYTLTAKAFDSGGLSTTSSPVTVTVGSTSTTCLISEPVPAASLYVVRNSWSNQYNGASVANDPSGAMKITHPAYGQNELWVIETGKNVSVTNGQVYTVKFDFKDFAGAPVSGIDVGFATGLNSSNNGPQLAQSVVAAPSGYSNTGFTTKTVNITSAVTASNVNLAFKLRWPGQPSTTVSDYIKNISLCKASSSARNADYEVSSLMVMPNPAIEMFTLRSEKSIDYMHVIDSQGREVYTTTNISKGMNFDFGMDFSYGIYNIAVVYSDGTSENHKILKIK